MTEIVEWVYHNGALEDPEGCGEVCMKLVNAQRELNETSMTQRLWDELGALETSTDLWGSMAPFGNSLGQVELGPVPLRIGWRIRNRERMGSKWEEIIGPAEPSVKSPACEGKWGARFRATGEEVGGLNGEGTSEKQLSPGNEWYLRLCGTTERIYLETQAEGTENGEPCFGGGKPVPGWELHRYWWNVCFEGYNSHSEPIFRKNLAYLFYKQFHFSRPQEWTGQHLTGEYTYNIETGEEGSGLTEAEVREATENALAGSSTLRYWIEWVLGGEHGTNPISGPTSAEEYGGSTSDSSTNKTRCMAGEPVNCATGNQVEQQTDLAVGGRGPGLRLTRTYNSQLAAAESSSGPFGYGWVEAYSAHLEYDEELEEMTVTENDGSQVRFLYNGEQWVPVSPLVQSQLAREGSGWIYTLPDQTVLHFNSSGRLTSEVDRNGNTITIAYNTEGRIETVSDASGRKLTYTYNGSHQVESVKDPMGHTVKYAYESGNLASVTLPGETSPRWKFKYNSEHEMTEKINGRGYAVKSEYNGSHQVTRQTDALERTRQWEYKTTEAGPETTITEPNGSVTVEKFNLMDQPVSVTHASGTALAATTTHEYNVEGELIATTDPDGHTTKYSYDAGGDRTSETDPEGDTTVRTYDSTHDVLALRRPDGELVSIVREAHGNPESITRSGTGVSNETTKYKYDSYGDLESVTNPLEHTTSYEYDTYGDKTAEIDPEGDKRTWEYNEDSQQTATVSPRGNASGGEPAAFRTTIERDQQGRPTVIVEPESNGTAKPSNVTAASVMGVPVEGATLTAAVGLWRGIPSLSYGYQWQRCNAQGTECANISGATASTHTVATADLKHTLRAIVTASNSYGSVSSTSAVSVVAGAVAPLAYVSSFGSGLNHPLGVAVDPHGNVWVANGYGNDIEKFSASGTLLATYGKYGTGNGEYHEPVGIAINQSTSNVYIADEDNNRVQELNEKGEWVRSWGSEGSENGQFKEAENIAIGASGHVFVTDWATTASRHLKKTAPTSRSSVKRGRATASSTARPTSPSRAAPCT
jgi:YD repeat-containing protein